MTYIQQRELEQLEARTSTQIHKALAGQLKSSDIEIIRSLKKSSTSILTKEEHNAF